MDYRIVGGYDWDSIQNGYKNGSKLVVTESSLLQVLPIPDAVPNNIISGQLDAGDTVYTSFYNNIYQTYMFVFRPAINGNYTDYGWIKKDKLKPYRKHN